MPVRTVRRFQSSQRLLCPSYRIVGVLDETSREWSSKGELAYPQSHHLLKDYAFWQFNHGDYTFSSIGEFQLNLVAVRRTDSSPCTDPREGEAHGSQGGKQPHSVLIFPERVWLRGLTAADLPSVMTFALNPEATFASLKKEVGIHVGVDAMMDITVLVQSGTHAPRADEVCLWLRDAGEALGLGERLDVLQASYAGPGTALSSANVVILPPAASEREDRLEFVVSKQAAFDILRKYLDAP